MSYILDALRKSESERQQGRVPDFAQQVQMIHRPRRQRRSVIIWVILALALLLNAGVLAYLFWPGHRTDAVTPAMASAPQTTEPAATQLANATGVAEPALAPTHSVPTTPAPTTPATAEAASVSLSDSTPPPGLTDDPVSQQGDPGVSQPSERPTVIVPSTPRPLPATAASTAESTSRVPHLVELPLSFQRSVPDLIFNSHIYASDPAARRVMINDHYLRIGDRFDGLRVERITEQGVVLSQNGVKFRVGTVRDWKRPR
ncbi:general secretion pathway protein GspB [Marinobacter sp. CA1]|uniref:general secretion pathway protein GspB n=1 Tax=Marinobacter sp. CA1 TaxID=2817656 RepID=UPI001D07847D|nr:general secretion pathway protein GspB [Marinobacter sp. CA1]UDL03283.1 general secretion pathway protein GspB [Marinobacter sp. CA1]